VSGAASIAYHLPGQAARTVALLPEDDRKYILGLVKERLSLGSDGMNYYYQVPQLFKMPKGLRSLSGDCACGGTSRTKIVFPFLAGAAVAYLLMRKGK